MDRNKANYAPLTPVGFLRRAAMVYPHKAAVIHGDRTYDYREFYERSCRLATALAKRGIGRGDSVAIMAPNIPAMLEAHYAVPMLGAVLNPINIRLDSKTVAFILEHGEARVLIADREFSAVVKQALAEMKTPPLVIDIDDALAEGGELLGEIDYESFLAEGETNAEFGEPLDEWQSICLL
jgi:fatty-acyl-CoA synthase